MQVIVDNLLTSYEKVGKGPTVLLLHGWGDTHTTFKQLTNTLKADHSVIAVDLPGFGGTQPPAGDWSLDDYCDFVSKFLIKIDEVKLKAVIGHSNGGAIAIRALAKENIKSDKLVLLASAGIRDVYHGRKKVLRLAAKAAKVATYPLPKSVQNKIKRRAYKAVGSDMFVAENLQETFKRVVTDDVQSDAKQLKLATILIYGSDDTATPPAYGELFHKAIQGSKMLVIEGAGHFVHHDKSDEVNKLTTEFLK